MEYELTVGISTHGHRREWLIDTISTLYFFNREKFKLVVVDNASEDDTLEYLEKLSCLIDIQIIKNKVNEDDTKAMNQILSVIRTDLFLKIDSDVVFVENNSITQAVDIMRATEASVVGPFWDLSITRRKEIFSWEGYHKMKSKFVSADNLAQQISQYFEVTMRLPRGNFMLMKTKHINEIGGFDEGYLHNAMEYPLIIRLIEAGYGYSEFSAESVIHKPSDDLRLKIRKIVPSFI